eukprot:510745-Hanusia_phi.AAC.1
MRLGMLRPPLALRHAHRLAVGLNRRVPLAEMLLLHCQARRQEKGGGEASERRKSERARGGRVSGQEEEE